MATLSLHQVRTNEGPAGYKIVSSVTAASGMPQSIFVFNSATEEFSHVATMEDFYWPEVRDVTKPYYRQTSATKFFSSVNVAIDFVTGIKNRVDVLVKSMTDEAVGFPGSDTTNYPLPTP